MKRTWSSRNGPRDDLGVPLPSVLVPLGPHVIRESGRLLETERNGTEVGHDCREKFGTIRWSRDNNIS
jgi:hypothetical protein